MDMLYSPRFLDPSQMPGRNAQSKSEILLNACRQSLGHKGSQSTIGTVVMGVGKEITEGGDDVESALQGALCLIGTFRTELDNMETRNKKLQAENEMLKAKIKESQLMTNMHNLTPVAVHKISSALDPESLLSRKEIEEETDVIVGLINAREKLKQDLSDRPDSGDVLRLLSELVNSGLLPSEHMTMDLLHCTVHNLKHKTDTRGDMRPLLVIIIMMMMMMMPSKL